MAAASDISPQAIACSVTYTASNWGGGGGFTAGVRITNLGDPLNGWTLSFAFPSGQRLSQGWNANWAQAAGSANVTATNLDWNRNLSANQSTDIGFNGTFTGTTNTAPTSFAINGVTCGGANQSPAVTMTSPATGASFQAGSNIALAATASDTDGSVTQVQFFANNTPLGTDTTSPYTFNWQNVAAGNYVLTARATDNGGAFTTSAPVDVTVTPNTGPSFVVSPASINVPEGATAPVAVRLSQQPTGSVSVATSRTSGDTDLTVSAGATLTFNQTTWNTPQNVTLAAAEDADNANG
ncbi:MAG TPA: cellulose binding domain-containing protein, partial [Micromonosporaceae bacterium]|nr:cellulose binding domain-containing protein [Micromonosporaceae bacterium]